ncbi:hypothetical protein K438DRAFT_1758306 [Mycena galopus ATCC 62051]|nr:hypothetical protein K438DRAFT_1758306 [Mycena galopus ATCC 62051]
MRSTESVSQNDLRSRIKMRLRGDVDLLVPSTEARLTALLIHESNNLSASRENFPDSEATIRGITLRHESPAPQVDIPICGYPERELSDDVYQHKPKSSRTIRENILLLGILGTSLIEVIPRKFENQAPEQEPTEMTVNLGSRSRTQKMQERNFWTWMSHCVAPRTTPESRLSVCSRAALEVCPAPMLSTQMLGSLEQQQQQQPLPPPPLEVVVVPAASSFGYSSAVVSSAPRTVCHLPTRSRHNYDRKSITPVITTPIPPEATQSQSAGAASLSRP